MWKLKQILRGILEMRYLSTLSSHFFRPSNYFSLYIILRTNVVAAIDFRFANDSWTRKCHNIVIINSTNEICMIIHASVSIQIRARTKR